MEELISSFSNSEMIQALADYKEEYKTTDLDAAYETLENCINEQVDLASAASDDQYRISLSASYILIVFTVFIGVIILLVTLAIIRPLKSADKQLQNMIHDMSNGQGDLNSRINIKSNDEIGNLVNGINGFIDGLQSIMKKI